MARLLDELTIRDFFASVALIAMANRIPHLPLDAEEAYEIADEMLEYRLIELLKEDGDEG